MIVTYSLIFFYFINLLIDCAIASSPVQVRHMGMSPNDFLRVSKWGQIRYVYRRVFLRKTLKTTQIYKSTILKLKLKLKGYN